MKPLNLSKEEICKLHEQFLMDSGRAWIFKKIMWLVERAPITMIIPKTHWPITKDNRSDITCVIETTYSEPFKTKIERWQRRLTKYELEAFPILLQTKTPTN